MEELGEIGPEEDMESWRVCVFFVGGGHEQGTMATIFRSLTLWAMS